MPDTVVILTSKNLKKMFSLINVTASCHAHLAEDKEISHLCIQNIRFEFCAYLIVRRYWVAILDDEIRLAAKTLFKDIVYFKGHLVLTSYIMYINFIVGTISSNLHIKTIQHSCKALSRKAEHTKRNHFINTVLVQ